MLAMRSWSNIKLSTSASADASGVVEEEAVDDEEVDDDCMDESGDGDEERGGRGKHNASRNFPIFFCILVRELKPKYSLSNRVSTVKNKDGTTNSIIPVRCKHFNSCQYLGLIC